MGSKAIASCKVELSRISQSLFNEENAITGKGEEQHTNLEFFRHAITSEGRVVATRG